MFSLAPGLPGVLFFLTGRKIRIGFKACTGRADIEGTAPFCG